MTSFAPVKLAYAEFDPVIGVDENLSPIIFLHGLSASKELWKDIPQVVANVTRRKVYALDARNHGDTEWTDAFSFDANIDDFLHFLDTIKAPKVIAVGHSMGGITIIKASLKEPERFEKVILEDISVRHINKGMKDTIAGFLATIQKLVQQITPEMDLEEAQNFIIDAAMKSLPAEIANNADAETRERYKLPMRRGPDGRFMPKVNVDAILNSMMESDKLMSDPEGLYEGPACFIYGTLSPFLVVADKHEIRKFFPKAEFVAIEDATHDVHTDRPLDFTDALLKFVS